MRAAVLGLFANDELDMKGRIDIITEMVGCDDREMVADVVKNLKDASDGQAVVKALEAIGIALGEEEMVSSESQVSDSEDFVSFFESDTPSAEVSDESVFRSRSPRVSSEADATQAHGAVRKTESDPHASNRKTALANEKRSTSAPPGQSLVAGGGTLKVQMKKMHSNVPAGALQSPKKPEQPLKQAAKLVKPVVTREKVTQLQPKKAMHPVSTRAPPPTGGMGARSSGETGSTKALKKQFEQAAQSVATVTANPQKSENVKMTLRRKKEEAAAAASAKEVPKKGSRLTSQSGECTICLEDAEGVVILPCCGFSGACRECVKDLVVIKMHVGLKTPCPNCAVDLPYTAVIKEVLDRENLELYNKKQSENALRTDLKATVYIDCGTPGCPEKVPVGGDIFAHCRRCQHDTCIVHNVSAYPKKAAGDDPTRSQFCCALGRQEQELGQRLAEQSHAALEAMRQTGELKSCPKCQREWGPPVNCNHSTCQPELGGCGFQFCWFCRADHLLIMRTDNSKHDPSCRFHPDNLH